MKNKQLKPKNPHLSDDQTIEQLLKAMDEAVCDIRASLYFSADREEHMANAYSALQTLKDQGQFHGCKWADSPFQGDDPTPPTHERKTP